MSFAWSKSNPYSHSAKSVAARKGKPVDGRWGITLFYEGQGRLGEGKDEMLPVNGERIQAVDGPDAEPEQQRPGSGWRKRGEG
jgi:hypothetical protein